MSMRHLVLVAVLAIRLTSAAEVLVDPDGTLTAPNMVLERATPAAVDEVVRGDDPRLSDARPAAGGDATTLGGRTAAAFLPAAGRGAAGGVASLDADGKVPVQQLPMPVGAVGGFRGLKGFTHSGTFTVPAGVTHVLVEIWGGGGGGGAARAVPSSYWIPKSGSGGMGGRGSYATAVVPVTPGETIQVEVGAGGAGGSGSDAGAPGGTSRFTAAVTAPGGNGGESGQGANGASGTGGVVGAGDLAVAGAEGGGPRFGIAGSFAGAGGAGFRTFRSSAWTAGTAGASGLVIVTW